MLNSLNQSQNNGQGSEAQGGGPGAQSDANLSSLKDLVLLERQKRDAQYEDFSRQG